MKDSKKMMLKQEIEREADQIEKELSENPDLEDVKVTEEMDQRMTARIEAYESAKSPAKKSKMSTNRKKNITPRFKRNIAAALALVVLLTAGLGITSVGSKSYLKEMIEKITGNATVEVTNVGDMNSQGSESNDEVDAYQEINKALGRTVVKIAYKPSGMEFTDYEIKENIQQAKMFYLYKDEVLQYMIYLNDNDSSLGKTEEDTKVNEENIVSGDIEVKIEEYQIKGSQNNRMGASFEYQGIQYQITAVMEKEDFVKIVENLYFPR